MNFQVPSPFIYVFTLVNATSLFLAVLANYLERNQTSTETYGTCSLIWSAMWHNKGFE